MSTQSRYRERLTCLSLERFASQGFLTSYNRAGEVSRILSAHWDVPHLTTSQAMIHPMQTAAAHMVCSTVCYYGESHWSTPTVVPSTKGTRMESAKMCAHFLASRCEFPKKFTKYPAAKPRLMINNGESSSTVFRAEAVANSLLLRIKVKPL